MKPTDVMKNESGLFADRVERGQCSGTFPSEGERTPAGLYSWFGLAVASLMLSGILSGVLVLGRVPAIARLVSDPWLFKRLLVCHVDLALVVWFGCSIAAMTCLMGGVRRWKLPSFAVAASGWGLLIVGSVLPGGAPVMANYVPVIDHPVFMAGVALFGVGLAMHLAEFLLPVRPAMAVETEDAAVRVAMKGAAAAFLVAVSTFAVAVVVTPVIENRDWYFERLMWGGGHVLQVAYTAAMIGAWLYCIRGLTGRPVMGRCAAAVLISLLVLPHVSAPFLAAGGTDSGGSLAGSSHLMRWGIFPVVLVVLGFCLRALLRGRSRERAPLTSDFRFLGFSLSAGLLLYGFILGAMIRGSNTLVPAHYHAAIGAITVIFMTMTYPVATRLFPAMSVPSTARGAARQLAAFGIGQAVFVAGFATGGFHDLPRKSYDGIISHMSPGLALGIGAMALGGMLALVGGLLYVCFLMKVAAAALPRTTASTSIPQKVPAHE